MKELLEFLEIRRRERTVTYSREEDQGYEDCLEDIEEYFDTQT